MAISPFKMSDLASLAGVSESTVSRALADSPLVSQKTRLEIQALAKKYGYVIDKRARNLRLQKSGVIAVIVPLLHNEEQSISDPFFLEMLGNLADFLSLHEYDLLLRKYTGKEDYSLDVLIRNISVDGVILIGQSLLHEVINQIALYYKPLVVWGTQMKNQNYITVGSDNYAGALEAVQYLTEKSRTKIAFFGNKDLPEIAPRYSGYVDALARRGVVVDPNLELTLPFDEGGVALAVKKFFDMEPDIDAVFAVSDIIAMQTIKILKDKNINVPEAVSVVGFDDVQLSRFFVPALTTVKQNIPKAAERIVKTLLSLISGQIESSTVIPANLVVRYSS